jgi:hypothetical protein
MVDWVAALRSGNFKQGKTYLNKDNVFCCLGVLCEVAHVPKTVSQSYIKYDGDAIALTKKLREQFNISYPQVDHLIGMNDNVPHKSFNEIADWIEANL